MPDTPYPLGRIEHHDPRSLRFGAGAAPVLKSIVHTPPPVRKRLDQIGNSCEGNAGAHLLNSRPFHRPFSRYYGEPEALNFYSLATNLDQFDGQMPDTDEGTSNLGLAKALQQLGKITTYQWSFGVSQALGTLMFKPLLAGVPWDEANFDVDGDGFIREGGREAGGHAIMIYAYSKPGNYLWMLNSWAGWGLQQRAKIRMSLFQSWLARGGEITSFVV